MNSDNIGTTIKIPIDDFNNNINQMNYNNKNKEEIKNINEIIITLKIEKEDLNKYIYFLDNINYIDYETNEKPYHEDLKELNETNTKIIYKWKRI